MKMFKNKRDKKEFKKILKNVNKLERMLNSKYSIFEQKIMKLKERFENRKKFKLVDYEKETFNYIFRLVSIVTYVAIILVSIFESEIVVKYSVLFMMILATSLVLITLVVILIMRRFDK